jgi:hypothetical protein
LVVLLSGQTEGGDYGIGTPGGKAGEVMQQSVTFPVPLAEEAPVGQVIYTKVSAPVEHCSGPGHADKEFVCIYSGSSLFVGTPTIRNPESTSRTLGTGRLGFFLEWTTTGADAFDVGPYTVTAG